MTRPPRIYVVSAKRDGLWTVDLERYDLAVFVRTLLPEKSGLPGAFTLAWAKFLRDHDGLAYMAYSLEDLIRIVRAHGAELDSELLQKMLGVLQRRLDYEDFDIRR